MARQRPASVRGEGLVLPASLEHGGKSKGPKGVVIDPISAYSCTEGTAGGGSDARGPAGEWREPFPGRAPASLGIKCCSP
jgi:hypothetical protein